MTSKTVLFIHTTIFVLFALASLSSPFVALYYPEFFSIKKLIVIGGVYILTIFTWPIFGGCPFTIWENRLRERESLGSTYKGPCIDRYVKKWFGITLPRPWSTIILLLVMVLPILSGLFLK